VKSKEEDSTEKTETNQTTEWKSRKGDGRKGGVTPSNQLRKTFIFNSKLAMIVV